MPIDPGAVGRSYGPYVYEAGLEKIREFALAVGGGVPSSSFSAADAPPDLDPRYLDGTLAPPTFCVTFNIRPFGAAIRDARNQIDALMLVHGEQEFEFLRPVRPGDVLTTTGAVTAALTKAGKDFLTVVCESRDARGELVVRGTYLAV